jgi:phosphatidylglycerophosphatase A
MSLADQGVVLLGTGLGVGFIPFAPGTFGSLWGPVLIWGVQQAQWSGPVIAIVAVLSTLIGIPICTRSSRALGKHDPGSVVYDEIAAFWIVYLPILIMDKPMSWKLAGAGFVLFRIFDIAKPWPVNRLEKLPDGTGIMLDDLAAGAFAAIGVLIIVVI